MGAESAGEVIDTAISYNRESAERGLAGGNQESCKVGHE